MAVNETIVTGRKFRKLIDAANKKWQRYSIWSKASDVEFNDGKSAETKVGAIKGITTDTNVTETGYAADATALTQLYSELADGLTNIRWNEESNRIEVYYNGAWVNYPPSFVGNSIYLIQNGVLLVPYTILIPSKCSVKQNESEFNINVSPNINGSSNYTAVISIDKEVSFDEPYQLWIQYYMEYSGSYVAEPNIEYKSKNFKIQSTSMVDVLVSTFNSGSGKITFGYTYSPNFTLHIKNLYFKRVRE